jgi:hypothetical protein
MHQDLRDLSRAGLYLLCLAVLIIGGTYGFALVVRQSAATFVHAVLPEAGSDAELTRISELIDNAREVRASLAKPLPPLEKLPPITATVAYGHFRPGGKEYLAVATRKPRTPSMLPKEAMDANAMATNYRAFNSRTTAVQPELHKVY